MATPQHLGERQDTFFFEFKLSEVNYGGKMRFQQAAFPPGASNQENLEYLIYNAIDRFGQLLEEKNRDELQPLTSGQPVLNAIYLDLWAAVPQVTYAGFRHWIEKHVQPIINVYRQIKKNALLQEQALRVKRLHYFAVLSTVTLMAEMISEYFEKHIDRLGRLALTARWTLGRVLSLLLLGVENDAAIRQALAENRVEQDPGGAIRRLFNPFVLAFTDAADAGLIDEILLGPNPYRIPLSLRNKINRLYRLILSKSKKFTAFNLNRVLSEPGNYLKVMQDRETKQKILRAFRKDRALRTELVLENSKLRLQEQLRRILEQTEVTPELMLFSNNDKRLLELLTKKGMRRQFWKHVKHKSGQWQEGFKRHLDQDLVLIKKSKSRWLGRLDRRVLLMEITALQERLMQYLSQMEDFKLVRSHYGRDSNQGASWMGLKLWRAYEMKFNKLSVSDHDRFVLNRVWEKKRIDVENSFAEGNMYLIRPQGDIYLNGLGRRNNVIFMFADLRNSTETTMKLTKDTASYLTPYLSAVNKAAKQCGGTRIYFAGDGFAAYFNRISDGLRAAYVISAHFAKLRKTSSEETIRKAKEIYQRAIALAPELMQPEKIRPVLQDDSLSHDPEVRDFLIDLANIEDTSLDEPTLKKALARAAESYSMPRIDAGIAFTTGELFKAMVGDEGEEKIPIVISPQLTQAARLSGSSEVVKAHIEAEFPQRFVYNVYTWDKKLYNRGIVLTKAVFEDLKQEVGLFPVTATKAPFNQEKLFFYDDGILKKRIVLRLCKEAVMLKGIDKPCTVVEVAPPGSVLDRLFGAVEQLV